MKKSALCLLLAGLMTLCCACAAAEGQYPSLSRGDYLTFGAMREEGNVLPILWRVISLDKDRAVLLSEEVLFSSPAQDGSSPFPGWEGCSLYALLNGPFLTDSFSEDEQAALMYGEDLALISLPSKELLTSLSDEERAARGTASAFSGGLYGEDMAPYWTRTESGRNGDALIRVTAQGAFSDLSVTVKNIGVRPMVLLSLEKLAVVSGDGSAPSPYQVLPPEASSRAQRIAPTPRPTRTPAPALTPDPTLSPTEAPALSPAPPSNAPETPRVFPSEYASLFPTLTEAGFLPEGEPEFVHSDPEEGLWLYASDSLRVEIVRKADTTKKKKPKRWLEAEIFVREGADMLLKNYYPDGNPETAELMDEADIAQKNRLVLALNGDWYYYRVQRNRKKYTMSVGVVLRDGRVLYDDPAKKATSTLPTRDILALFPDGRMEPFDYNAISGQELLAQGAYEALCFGPVLLKDGLLTDQARKISDRQGENPRSGIGMVSPGRYVAIAVEGGTKVSVGMKLAEFADLFAQRGCLTAYNLNGGGAANLIFMGEYLTENKAASQNRQQNEVLGIGETGLIQ